MLVLPQITGGRRIGLAYGLLAVAIATGWAGMYYSGYWWLAVVGVLAFIGFGLLSDQPAYRPVRRGSGGMNPASDSAIIPGTHTDSQGRYYGSTGR